MRLRRLAAISLAAALFTTSLLAGCGRNQPPPAPAPAEPPEVVLFRSLTREEKVGQLLWFGLNDTAIPDETAQLVREGKAGGILLFHRGGEGPAAVESQTKQLQALAKGRERPTPGLFIAVDQEGGRVQRFRDGFTVWPGSMALGATGSLADAELAARTMGAELAAVGVNVDLAPVADVNNNPANPVIGIRSFGEDPEVVAQLVTASVKGFQAAGVAAVAKHFPGHGDTDLDTHKQMPVIKHAKAELEQVELRPFKAAVAARIDGIMSAHISFPAVATNGAPATLSPEVLQGLLRKELGFTGIAVTDALEMKAIADQVGVAEGLVKAIAAGADAALVTESHGQRVALYQRLLTAVEKGEITADRLDEAVRRVLALKARLGLLSGTTAAERPALSTVGSSENQQLADRIGADALTLVRNRDLPLRLSGTRKVLVAGPQALIDSVQRQHPQTEGFLLDDLPTAEQAAAIKRQAAGADAIVIGLMNAQKNPSFKNLANGLIATGKPVVVVGMREPYDLTVLPQAANYVAAYGSEPSNLAGIGPLLFGKASPKGKLPVSIPGLYPRGHGLSY